MNPGMRRVSSKYGEFWVYPESANDIVSNVTAAGGCWDDFMLPIINEVAPGRTVIDVGANIGTFTIYAAKRGLKVYSFEACPENYEVLVENVKLNNLDVTAHNVALYDTEREMQILGRTVNEKSGFAVIPTDAPNSTYRSRTLDSYDLQDVALLKIDAQGCDLRIMRGALNLIKSQKPVIVYEIERSAIELRQYERETDDDYHNLIREIGYTESELPTGSDFVARYNGFMGESNG